MVVVFNSATDVSYAYLKKIWKYGSNILYFNNTTRNWYFQSKDIIISIIQKFSREKNIFFGESMGGFGSLFFSKMINNFLAIAFNPQTFDFNNNKNILIHDFNNSPIMKYLENIPDLKMLFKNDNINNFNAYIFCGIGEETNGVMFVDLLHSGYLLGSSEKIKIIITKYKKHSFAGDIDTQIFFEMIDNNYYKLYNDDDGIYIFKNNFF